MLNNCNDFLMKPKLIRCKLQLVQIDCGEKDLLSIRQLEQEFPSHPPS
jgi:hypothetical protein